MSRKGNTTGGEESSQEFQEIQDPHSRKSGFFCLFFEWTPRVGDGWGIAKLREIIVLGGDVGFVDRRD